MAISDLQPLQKIGLVLIVCLLGSGIRSSFGQDLDSLPETTESPSKLEDAVIADMLRIVDRKFDTLTTRITSLEHAVNGLQYYTIHQYRQLRGSIQTTENDIETVGKQVGQLEVDGRGIKIAMSLLGRDVSALKTTTADLLGELESSVGYINDNVDKQVLGLKSSVEEAISKSMKETGKSVERRLEEIQMARENEKPRQVNCSGDFSVLSERIDRRFAEFKQHTYAHCAQLIDAARNTSGHRASKQHSETNDVTNTKNANSAREVIGLQGAANDASSTSDSDSDVNEVTPSKGGVQGQSSNDGVPVAEKISSPQTRKAEKGKTSTSEEDDKIMDALYNMTDGILQAVSYFRLSERTMEQIASNTDIMVLRQETLERDLAALKAVALSERQSLGESFDVNNKIPGSQGRPAVGDGSYHAAMLNSRGSVDCLLPNGAIQGIVGVIRNGSQLVEVLTDLAQMSSVSLTSAVDALQDEVKRVEAIRTRMATQMVARDSGSNSDPVTRLTNVTERTFKLVDAIASNTGWLPFLVRKVQHVENLANRSVHVTNKSQATLQQIRFENESFKKALTNHMAVSVGKRKVSSNEILQGNEKNETLLSANAGRHFPHHVGVSLDRNSLQTIYSTSLQLNRIMPALTKLLAEPDPLITLVGGGKPDRGRIEIYDKGQWGTICHRNLSHQEADVVCRHLGFHGGISAGSGFFGSGTGIAWNFNASCLSATSSCSVVGQLDDAPACSHENDVSVICDHMLRIVSEEDPIAEVKSKSGRLEMHHKGLWLPICGEGWSGHSARVACIQMGFTDGRERSMAEWQEGTNSTWLNKVACLGNEMRLDACQNDGWSSSCADLLPAGIKCL